MSKALKSLIKESQVRARKLIAKMGTDEETILDGNHLVWPPSAALDLKRLRLPLQK